MLRKGTGAVTLGGTVERAQLFLPYDSVRTLLMNSAFCWQRERRDAVDQRSWKSHPSKSSMVFSDNLEQWAQQTSSMVSTLYLSFLQTSLTPATKQQHCSIWDHQGTSAPPHLARGVDFKSIFFSLLLPTSSPSCFRGSAGEVQSGNNFFGV